MKTRDDLLDRIAQLEEILGLTGCIPTHTKLRDRKLAPQEAKFLGLLMNRAMVSLDAGYLALYGDLPDSEQPEGFTTLRTVIKRLRKFLRAVGVEIRCIYGEGYLLEPDQKEKLRAAWPELGQGGRHRNCEAVNNGATKPSILAKHGPSEFKRENSLVG